MNVLMITANPSNKSFTKKVTEKLTELIKEKWYNFFILDLYKTDLKQDFLNYEDQKEIWKDEITKKIQEKILWANELIFIFPIWWWDCPAIMKNFFDCNFTSWFAFKYENWKNIWLLNWKTSKIISFAWWPTFFYKIILHIQILWKLNRMSFCWIKLKKFIIFWKIQNKETNKDLILKKLKKII